MKTLIRNMFPAVVRWRNRIYNYWAHYRFKSKPAEAVFETIYKENHWKDGESKSGTGSNRKSAEVAIKIVSDTIAQLHVRSMIDIPCGDFNWMKEVVLNDIDYCGADIVKDIVDSNNEAYADAHIKFEKINILESALPKVDLIFTRDCLVHFSFADIFKAIRSVKESGSTYWMTTTFPEYKNYDIITGDWRPINLQASPFNFPEPIFICSENFVEDIRFKDKSLAVWKIIDL